jgi:hypothetical protein
MRHRLFRSIPSLLEIHTVQTLIIVCASFFLGGCVSVGGSAMESHKKGMGSLTENEYVTPKKPVDRHYIGSAWSRQFGPIEDTASADIRVKKERSLNAVQQDYAYSRGISLGGQSILGNAGEIGVRGGSVEKTRLEGVEIISPVSIADIPFEPKVPYVTEALRLANFRIQDEKSQRAGLGLGATTPVAAATGKADTGSQSRTATEGEGLVVAYKLHTIDLATYIGQESGPVPLELEKVTDFPKAGVFVKARLQVIDPGAGRSLPRNILWSCARADARSRDMVAAWLVDIRPADPQRKPLTIAFPAHPRMEECQNFSGVIYSRIDPLTDKIVRQKIRLTLIDAEVTDSMKPAKWDARVSLVDESFNIRLVRPSEMEEPLK